MMRERERENNVGGGGGGGCRKGQIDIYTGTRLEFAKTGRERERGSSSFKEEIKGGINGSWEASNRLFPPARSC